MLVQPALNALQAHQTARSLEGCSGQQLALACVLLGQRIMHTLPACGTTHRWGCCATCLGRPSAHGGSDSTDDCRTTGKHIEDDKRRTSCLKQGPDSVCANCQCHKCAERAAKDVQANCQCAPVVRIILLPAPSCALTCADVRDQQPHGALVVVPQAGEVGQVNEDHLRTVRVAGKQQQQHGHTVCAGANKSWWPLQVLSSAML